MNDGLLATGWAISAGERYPGDASIDEVQAACDAAYGAFFTLSPAEAESHAAYCAAGFAHAVRHRYFSVIVKARLRYARRAFKAAYP